MSIDKEIGKYVVSLAALPTIFYKGLTRILHRDADCERLYLRGFELRVLVG
jgi:hypothetical protein